MPQVRGQFVSVWSEGVFKTNCTLNMETGELNAETVDVPNDVGVLEREYFETPEGDEIPVCPTCHEFILQPAMIPAVGSRHTFLEDKECMNLDCDSRE